MYGMQKICHRVAPLRSKFRKAFEDQRFESGFANHLEDFANSNASRY